MRLWGERKRYEVYHFGDFVLFPLALLARRFSPSSRIVITVHGLDLLYGNRQGIKAAIYRRFIAWAARRQCVDHFVANSRNTAAICSRMGFNPVRAIPLGVRTLELLEPARSTEPFILFVGRLVPRKGARWFAEDVLPLLPQDVKFYVVGKTWDAAETAALRKNPRVRLFGIIPDTGLRELKRKCLVMVMPNVRSVGDIDVEGFGIVAVEAAAQGVPLIASDIEGLSDAILHEKTGFLVPSGNADAWRRQIDTLMAWTDNDRRMFATQAQSVVARYYLWDRVAEDTLAVYK